MSVRVLILFLIFFGCAGSFSIAQNAAPETADQQINDFSLAGYGDQGKKTWELFGKTADLFTDVVKLNNIVGNLYGKQENIKLEADKGDFNKAQGLVHLQQNVVITTSSGARLTTDALDWDRKNNVVTTDDKVNIVKENLVTEGRGASGEPGLSKVTLEKDVSVQINPSQQNEKATVKEKIVITCDGPLNIDYAKNVAVFNKNVVIVRQDSEMHSDTMEVYFNADKNKKDTADGAQDNVLMTGSKIEKMIAKGNVKILQGENVSYCDEATYTSSDRKITLQGRPQLIIYSTDNLKDMAGGKKE